MALTAQHIKFITNFIYEKSGIVLNEKKQYLIESRLARVARISGMGDAARLCEQLRRSGDPQLETLVIDALTTNETSWFRDRKPFDALASVYLPWRKKWDNGRRLNIWSAACSTGQESYSIAMVLMESGILPGWRTRLIATDISQQVLEKAKAGIYSQIEINRGLPVKMLVKYFRQLENGDWQIKESVRQHVRFAMQNLLTDPVPAVGLDLIFCRNVLIYFSKPDKQQVLRRLHRHLAPMGLLALGATETTIGIYDGFRPIHLAEAVFYCRAEDVQRWQETLQA